MMASDSNAIAELINEIHWLSAELKRRTALRSEQQKVLLASKGLLDTLAEQGPRTAPAIAEARNTSRQNIQIIANRLANLGCIEFVPNPHHKKSDLLRLTPSGTALLKSSTRQESAVLNVVAALMNEAEATTVLEGLKHLHGILAGECEAGQENKSSARRRSVASEGSESNHPGRAGDEQTKKSVVPEEEPIQEDSLPVNLL